MLCAWCCCGLHVPDPYAPIWLANTAKPRASYRMHPITWCAFPDDEPDEDGPSIQAIDRIQQILANAGTPGAFATRRTAGWAGISLNVFTSTGRAKPRRATARR